MYFGGSGCSGDESGTKLINSALYGNGTNSGNGKLQSHGNAGMQKPCYDYAIYAQIILGKLQKWKAFADIEKTEYAGYELGNYRCPACPGNTHMKDKDKKEIEAYV